MDLILKDYSIKHDLMCLFVVVTLLFIGYCYALNPFYMPTSKIEDGEVIVRNDSVTTVVIRDKR